MFPHYSDEPVDVAVRLTNTLNVVTGEDELEAPQDVADLLRELGDGHQVPAALTEEDLRSARALRSRLRAVWEAGSAEQAAAAINDILDIVRARPRISVHDDTPPHLHFDSPADDPVMELGALAAMGLSVALIEGGWERFGTCSSTTCDDVFIDRTKNRSRRHCSETCTTRESVAAYRARQKAGAIVGGTGSG